MRNVDVPRRGAHLSSRGISMFEISNLDPKTVQPGTFRLMDGGRSSKGRVEVYYNGSWGTVCGSMWDIRGAGMVCRSIQCRDLYKYIEK